MASPTPNLGLTYPAHGGSVNAWDTPLNTDFDTIDLVIAGTYSFSGAGGGAGSTLTQTQANNRRIIITGALSVQNYLITFPAIGGLWIIDNQTTGNFTVTAIVLGSAATPVTCSRGLRTPVSSNGTDLVLAADSALIAIPYSGNPNGNVAGTAATAYNPPSVVWDYTNLILYLCTTTGNAAGAVWSAPSSIDVEGLDMPTNYTLSVTHTGGNLLQIALKNGSGVDPTAGSPVISGFQTLSGSNTTGSYTSVSVTTALSMTSNATGATLGSSNNVPFRLWIALFNNAGTAVLAIRNCSTATAIYSLAEYGVASTTGISGSATSAGVWYTPNGTTLTNCAFRIIGYCEYTSGLATAGTYTSDPSNTVLFGPGVKLSGDIVQVIYSTATASTTVVNSTPVRTNTTASIAPTSSINPVRVTASGTMQGGASSLGAAQLSRGIGPTLIGSTGGNNGSGPGGSVSLEVLDIPSTTSTTSYSVYIWNSTGGGTTQWIGTIIGLAAQSTIILQEIMG